MLKQIDNNKDAMKFLQSFKKVEEIIVEPYNVKGIKYEHPNIPDVYILSYSTCQNKSYEDLYMHGEKILRTKNDYESLMVVRANRIINVINCELKYIGG